MTSKRALAFLNKYNCSLPCLKGHSILARVMSLTGSIALVDPGYYGFCEISRADLRNNQVYDGRGLPVVRQQGDVREGDYVKLRLRDFYSPFGTMRLEPYKLSPEMRHKLVWEELAKAHEQGTPVYGRILNTALKGYAVGVSGYVGLLPFNKATLESVEKIGVLQAFYVLKLDAARNMLLLADPRFKPDRRSAAPMYTNIASLASVSSE